MACAPSSPRSLATTRSAVHGQHRADHPAGGAAEPVHVFMAAPARAAAGGLPDGSRLRGDGAGGLLPHGRAHRGGLDLLGDNPAARGIGMGRGDRACAPPWRVHGVVRSVAFATGPWLGATVYDNYGADILWGLVFLCGCLSAALLAITSDPPKPGPLRDEPADVPQEVESLGSHSQPG